mmetsp:Transcript_3290/g.5770  ORF Transcript_3290/g.5770 Transcript_3290/m.5770 type:complete len:244 (-) Transcript_3290:64-795(-)
MKRIREELDEISELEEFSVHDRHIVSSFLKCPSSNLSAQIQVSKSYSWNLYQYNHDEFDSNLILICAKLMYKSLAICGSALVHVVTSGNLWELAQLSTKQLQVISNLILDTNGELWSKFSDHMKQPNSIVLIQRFKMNAGFRSISQTAFQSLMNEVLENIEMNHPVLSIAAPTIEDFMVLGPADSLEIESTTDKLSNTIASRLDRNAKYIQDEILFPYGFRTIQTLPTLYILLSETEKLHDIG